jgi:hypothetical protein
MKALLSLGMHPGRERVMGRAFKTVLGILLVTGIMPSPAEGQRRGPDTAAIDAYYRTVGRAFSVSLDELGILGEWQLPAEEITVVLFLARRAGVSPDVIASQRDTGAPWATIAQRYGVGAGVFRISFPPETSLGRLESTYQSFSDTPRASWNALLLDDRDLVALVNIRVLSNELGVAAAEALAAWGRTANLVLVHQQLTNR